MAYDDKPAQSPAVSVNKPGDSKMGRGCIFLFCGIFFFAGLAVCTFTVLVPVYHAYDAMDWQETPCTIVSSAVETHDGDDGDTYSIQITYRYQFNGAEYTGGQYDFTLGSSSGYDGKKAVVDRYPVGLPTNCFVDPQDPASAVLNRHIPNSILWGLISLPFLLVGIGGILAVLGFFTTKKGPGESFQWKEDPSTVRGGREFGDYRSRDFAPISPSRPISPITPFSPPGAYGPITLKPASSPLGMFIASIVVTLFWNGIVSVFVVGFLGGMFNGDFKSFDICLALFLTPFVLVGLAMIFWVGHSFLSLFNPRPTLTVSSASAAIGETIRVSWSFRGNTHSIRRLHIFLHGKESATYRRGTNTTTDHATFAKLAIVDTTNYIDMSTGQGEVTIPTDTMHSFDSAHNKIVWSIDLSGEIAWWPDVTVSFPYTILPMGRGTASP